MGTGQDWAHQTSMQRATGSDDPYKIQDLDDLTDAAPPHADDVNRARGD